MGMAASGYFCYFSTSLSRSIARPGMELQQGMRLAQFLHGFDKDPGALGAKGYPVGHKGIRPLAHHNGRAREVCATEGLWE